MPLSLLAEWNQQHYTDAALCNTRLLTTVIWSKFQARSKSFFPSQVAGRVIS